MVNGNINTLPFEQSILISFLSCFRLHTFRRLPWLSFRRCYLYIFWVAQFHFYYKVTLWARHNEVCHSYQACLESCERNREPKKRVKASSKASSWQAPTESRRKLMRDCLQRVGWTSLQLVPTKSPSSVHAGAERIPHTHTHTPCFTSV